MSENSEIINNNIPHIEANVKWYNPEKGYGFLNQPGNSADIMIHFSALDKVGCPYIKVGDKIICEIGYGRSGLQVVRVIEVILGTPGVRSLSTFIEEQTPSYDPADLEEITGTLKWYNSKKGYGFIYPDDGRREVFLHGSVLRAAGYKFLEPGARVVARISSSDKGEEACFLTVLLEEKEETKMLA